MLLTALAAQTLGPLPALACTCGPPEPLAVIAHRGDVAIFSGIVGVPQGNRVPVHVEEWWHGDEPAAVAWLGLEQPSSCGGANIGAGSNQIFVAYGPGGGPYRVGGCAPGALRHSTTGEALADEARAAFGPAWRPPPTIDATAPPAAPADRGAIEPLATWPYVVVIIGGAAILLVIVAVIAARRRSAA